MPLGTMVGLVPGNIMLNADPASPPKGHSPLISAHVCFGQTAECIKMPLGLSDLSCLPVTLVYCGQTVRWIKIKLGMQVGLGLGHIVLDGTQLPCPKVAQPPIFGPYLLWPNGWMN